MNRLESAMMAVADPSQVDGLSRFFKCGPGQYGEGDKFLGIKVPMTRQVVRNLWKDCPMGDLHQCMLSPYHEVRLAALLVLVQQFRHTKEILAQQGQIDFYLTHMDYVNNWDLVDLSCYELLGVWLLDKDRQILYDLAQCNHLWKQRIAMVSTMQFLRHGQLDDTYAIADLLLPHRHDLIQKAVGWLLREAGKRDEVRLMNYLRERYTAIPRTTLRYAIERFEPSSRNAFLKGVG
ncbi:MAG: DNA alkylation repair protein [Bacteroidales bacterium]|nr:DNA alkylation repair protein [Bacteroidales bacterium]